MIEHTPDAGSEWPILDFTEPINRGFALSFVKTSSMAEHSSGSPTNVPKRTLKCNISYVIQNDLKNTVSGKIISTNLKKCIITCSVGLQKAQAVPVDSAIIIEVSQQFSLSVFGGKSDALLLVSVAVRLNVNHITVYSLCILRPLQK